MATYRRRDFAWVLGLGFAGTVGILNALWYELRLAREGGARNPADASP